MQNRVDKKIDLKGWEIVREGNEFRFYNKNVQYCHRDKYPWLIGEFKISLKNNRVTLHVNRMVPDAITKIYFADRESLDPQRSSRNYVEQYKNESLTTFFISPYSNDYENNKLYNLYDTQNSTKFFMTCTELGLYAHAQCKDDASYAAFIKDGLSILALVEPSLKEAISVIQSELDSISIEPSNQLKVDNKW